MPPATPPSDAAPVEPEPRRSGFGLALWLGVLLLVGYPLSTGPACWLWWKGWLSDSVMKTAYAPLEFLARNCPPVEDFFQWYVMKFVHWERPLK